MHSFCWSKITAVLILMFDVIQIVLFRPCNVFLNILGMLPCIFYFTKWIMDLYLSSISYIYKISNLFSLRLRTLLLVSEPCQTACFSQKVSLQNDSAGRSDLGLWYFTPCHADRSSNKGLEQCTFLKRTISRGTKLSEVAKSFHLMKRKIWSLSEVRKLFLNASYLSS